MIEISPLSCEIEKKVFHLVSEQTESPIGHIICLKSAEDVKLFEETEECFILDFDPFETPDLSKLSVSSTSPDDDEDAPDVAVVAEKGQALSNGICKSVWHRAVVNADKPRLSVASFLCPFDEAVIRPAKGLTGDDESGAIYKGYTYAEYYKKFWSRNLDQNHCLECFKNQ